MSGPDGRLGQGTGDVGLAHPGRAGEDQVVVPGHPRSGGQLHDETPVEPSRCPQVEVLDRGGVAELRHPQPHLQAAGVTCIGLPVDEETEPVLEGELGEASRVGQLIGQALGHGLQAQVDELLGGGAGEHHASSAQ